jgi:hypothetical protein
MMRWYVDRLVTMLFFPAAIMSAPACSEYETGYYKGRVNDATQEVVMRRYGTPHDRQEMKDGRTVWTYFDRGSGTSGYTGYARSQYCRAYVLTFDQDGILRDWRQDDCSEKRSGY